MVLTVITQILFWFLFVLQLKAGTLASSANPSNNIENRVEFNKACNAFKFESETEAIDLVGQLERGGPVHIQDGDHFCGSMPISLRADASNVTGASRSGTRVWGAMDIYQTGSLRRLASCWEARDGFRATLALLPAASWEIADCEVLSAGGVAVAVEEASLDAARCCLGGFGTGPRPSASAGALVWARGDRPSRAGFADCAFQHTVGHAARYAAPAAAGRLVGCTLRNCGRGVAAVTPDAVRVI
jgi:hypothetical protein